MKRREGFWAELIAAVLSVFVGLQTILTQHLGSWTVREFQASGTQAKIVGFLFLAIGVALLINWIRKFRRR